MRNARTRFLFFRRPLPNPNRFPRRQRTAAVRRSRFWLRYFPTGPPNSTATAAISASQKSDKTNWTGQAPIRNIPISSGTEPDYFRSTPTKATIPISVPTKIPANHWHRYATAPMPKTKTDNRLTTSTATKSAYRKR